MIICQHQAACLKNGSCLVVSSTNKRYISIIDDSLVTMPKGLFFTLVRCSELDNGLEKIGST